MVVTSRSSTLHHARLRTAVVGFLALAIALAVPAVARQSADAAGNPATVPVDRLGESWWAERHEAVLKAIQSQRDTQLLMIGDSITNNYDKSTPPDENFLPTWKDFYEPRKAL